MKFVFATVLLGLISAVAYAAAPQSAIIVSFPSDTPVSIIDQAKEAIVKAGGAITHEYKIIKGFVANAPAEAIDAVRAMDERYRAVVEFDQIARTQDDDGGY